MTKYQCIVSVSKRGKGNDVVDAARRNGARGSTILKGKGSSVYESKRILNALTDPEKDIVITLIEKTKANAVKEAIERAINVDTPGEGVIFVLDAADVRGLTEIDDIDED